MAKLGYAAIPTHPGEVVKDELEARNITQKDLARAIGISCSVLNEILNARRPITAKTALLFEAALDIPAVALMNIQTKFNLHQARENHDMGSLLTRIRKAVALW
ncbi:MAG: HigA family addiction module antidote protein [Muribaculaceae bacterium]|nr:HigA family addiction module antidote protein [Muribaculaceae bacterium]